MGSWGAAKVWALAPADGGSDFVASFEGSYGRNSMASTADGSDFAWVGPGSAAGSDSGSLPKGLVSGFRPTRVRAFGASARLSASPSVLVLFFGRSELTMAEKGRAMAANIVIAGVCRTSRVSGGVRGGQGDFIDFGAASYSSEVFTHSRGPRSVRGRTGGWLKHFRPGPAGRTAVVGRLQRLDVSFAIPLYD